MHSHDGVDLFCSHYGDIAFKYFDGMIRGAMGVRLDEDMNQSIEFCCHAALFSVSGAGWISMRIAEVKTFPPS